MSVMTLPTGSAAVAVLGAVGVKTVVGTVGVTLMVVTGTRL